MNPYGDKAQKHWAKWLPMRYRNIEDPEAFFSALGEEAEDEVITLAAALAGPDLPGETFMEKRGRLNMVRLNAESQSLAEMVLLPPEDAGAPAEELGR